MQQSTRHSCASKKGFYRRRFVALLLAWFDVYGRGDLPWRGQQDAYGTWVSEIMLQQTQVATVRPYYQRFMAAFPNPQALAEAPLDRVLQYWSGLGYYARARHLHQAAAVVVTQHRGCLPRELASLLALPGIGRSTAGAIASLAYGERAAILDANVRRVLGRFFAVSGSGALLQRRCWRLAEALLPRQRCGDYNQALMDFGATICRPRQPLCGCCSLAFACAAQRQGRVADYPSAGPSVKRLTIRIWWLFIVRADAAVWLEKRPPKGRWGGLWSLPELSLQKQLPAWWEAHFEGRPPTIQRLPVLHHGLTHRHLELRPLLLRAGQRQALGAGVWCHHRHPPGGLAAPVARLLRHQAGDS